MEKKVIAASLLVSSLITYKKQPELSFLAALAGFGLYWYSYSEKITSAPKAVIVAGVRG